MEETLKLICERYEVPEVIEQKILLSAIRSPSCEAIYKCIGKKDWCLRRLGLGRGYYIPVNVNEVLEKIKKYKLGAKRVLNQETAFNALDDDDRPIDTEELIGGFLIVKTYPYKNVWKPLYRVDGRRVNYEGSRWFINLGIRNKYREEEYSISELMTTYKYLGAESFTRLRSGKFYMRIEDEESDEERIINI